MVVMTAAAQSAVVQCGHFFFQQSLHQYFLFAFFLCGVSIGGMEEGEEGEERRRRYHSFIHHGAPSTTKENNLKLFLKYPRTLTYSEHEAIWC